MTARDALATSAVLALGAAALAGCGGGADAAVDCPLSDIPDHDDRTLVVEGDAWSGYAPFRQEDLLAGTGYELVYVEQVCQDVRAADLSAGRADIAVTSLDQYLIHHPEATLVGVIDQSLGADALALGTANHPDLDNVDDIPALVEEYAEDGRKPVLAYTGNSPSEMLLNELANARDELRLANFELVSVDQSATAYEMLERDEAQVAVIWEPDTSAARAAGHSVVMDSADVPGAIVDVILVSDQLIARDPEAVRAVVGSFYSTMDGLLPDDDALIQFYAEDGGLDPRDAGSIVDGIELYGSVEADRFLNEDLFPLDVPRMEQSINSIGSLLALLDHDINVDRARVDGSYVHELVP